MVETTFLFLTYNTALLLLLVLMFDLISKRWSTGQSIHRQILVGIMLGLIGTIIIQTHWTLESGAIFDTRSILLSIAGLFFGPIPTSTAMIITAAMRYAQGGVGILTGISVIIATGGIGILWRRHYGKPLTEYTFKDFYLFGVAVHIVMILLMFTFPWEIAKVVLQTVSLPVLIIYPVGTALLGSLMTYRLQREKLAEKIREEEAKFKIIADHTSDWDYWVGTDHRFLYCSPSCKLITGYADHEFVNDPALLGKIVYPEDRPVFDGHKHAVSVNGSGQVDFRIIHRDGSVRWIGHACVPVYNREGNFAGTRGSNRDITGQKESQQKIIANQREIEDLLYIAEQSRKTLLSVVEDQKIAQEKLAVLNEQLEERVAQRTQELERANKELEAFSYSVSHDLRAPLRGIDGWSAALDEDYGNLLDEQGKKYIRTVRQEAQKMGQLIDDLLQLSRLARTEFHMEQIDVSSLAQAIALRMQNDDPQRRVRVQIEPGLLLHCDARLMEAALLNLFSNAFKFTRKQPEPLIEFGRTSIDGTTAFFIRDNGAGFDMKFAGKLFGAFQRMHKSSEFPGTGVGLAIVQRVIHRHGGRVWAEAAPDRGATFYFTIKGDQ